ncbi:DNA alkylation repair protein [Nitratireductor sp. CAU 1489]|uniref:DNA alkylation repair protein n=1 Tax=Nitratireductor arenosus TaxID=2682096 RepID=A0A844QCW7_9HYPH|nr:DNA alkylation repair protein [Nitratireductor arenosus]MVA95958.1 DNA alkylation repair protein [Nitratireductor arenosus]
MTEPSPPLLKDILDRERMHGIAQRMAALCPDFAADSFIAHVTDGLDALGIMQRVRRIATSLHAALPGGFEENVRLLQAFAPDAGHPFVAIALSDYVALHGADRFESSVTALKELTRYGSSEYAVRPFLDRDLHRTLAVMAQWAHDPNEHVRRLASEGCRPRLPWSFQIKALIADPAPVAAILDTLKADPSLYVRKSVANHLNDIAKDHPDWVLDLLQTWPRDDPRTAWIVRHGLRTLIKQGNNRALALIGAGAAPVVDVERFAVTPAAIVLGAPVTIEARLVSRADTGQRLVVDYAIHYVKKSGATSRKVFKLKQVELAPGDRAEMAAVRMVRDFTTRKHHAGRHRVELLVNGRSLAETVFDLALTAG